MSAAAWLALWLADEQPADGIWGQPVVLGLITLVGVLAAAAIGAIATVQVKKLNRGVDDATTAKTLAEAEKARVDVHGREVEIARGLLADIRTELDRVRADQERSREETEKRLREQSELAEARHRELTSELARLMGSHARLKQRLDEHIPWDHAAREVARQADPQFPDFPPLHD